MIKYQKKTFDNNINQFLNYLLCIVISCYYIKNLHLAIA